MNERTQRTFICAVAIGGVKTAKAVAAESATAFGIQGKRVLEWRSTTDTEKFSAERLGRFQASATYRDPADLLQWSRTDAAIARKEKGKKGVGG
jgi:hypothetical protein